jgi:uncharacterized protein YjbI with pentapeptide repeats
MCLQCQRREIAVEEMTPERPEQRDRESWRAYWDSVGQPWRFEPEISPERQHVLADRRAAGAGNAPFAGVRLSRADVEWLLATHESRGMRGPVDAEDPEQRLRDGVNLQGADLRQARLGGLPLARANLSVARLDNANLSQAHLERASFAGSQLVSANLAKAWLMDASFRQANLQDANLTEAHLESANLFEANCRGAALYIAHLEGAYIGHACLAGATIGRAFFDVATSWNDAILWDDRHVSPSLADAHWGETNLATIDWSQVRLIGDEQEARSRLDRNGKPKDHQKRLDDYRRAVRANRQLVVALRSQGMNEEADRFAYRAQLCQRSLYRYEGKINAHLGSRFLDLLAGYGYKPLRTLAVYLVVISGYALAYATLASQGAGSALSSPVAALVFSITSFHGRGFFPGGLPLDSSVTVLAATEAIVGLIIEVSFIATFTQRFFAR